MGRAAGQEAAVNYHGPYVPLGDGGGIASRVFLRHDNELKAVDLILYPADTLTQARAFYGRPAMLAGLKDLCDRPGWGGAPHFHFGHFQRGYCWTTVVRDVDDYVTLWAQQFANGVSVIPRAQWDDYWAWLESEQIAVPADRAKFDHRFTNTNRQTASPRPGLWVARRWTMDDAIALDGAGKLSDAARDEFNTALAAFGEPPLAVAAGAAFGQP